GGRAGAGMGRRGRAGLDGDPDRARGRGAAGGGGVGRLEERVLREAGGARGFGSALWEALGEKRNPTIVFEHPGETTLPTSCFVCETGGMVVICAGTT